MPRHHAFDGLRAVAALLVVAKHLHVPFAQGGWLGVDVFFVLSGYLITTLLLDEHARTGEVRVGRFWLRRLARLYPALVLMVLAGLLVAPERFDGAFGTEVSALLALTWTGDLTWYSFDAPPGFGHTWSLAVEEQFYLMWPFVLLACGMRRARVAAVGGLLVAAGAVALTLAPGTTPPDEGAAYYQPHTRAWEIVAGGVLAVVLPRCAPSVRAASAWLAVAPVLGVALLRLGGRPGTPLAPVVLLAAAWSVAVVAALVVAPRARVARVLAARPLVWLGRVSYGVYLYHWVVVVALRAHLPGPEAVGDLLAVAVTVALAGLSFHLVEQPVRRRARAALDRRREPSPGRTVPAVLGGA